MSVDETDRRRETNDAGVDAPPRTIADEANAGREDLVEAQRQAKRDLEKEQGNQPRTRKNSGVFGTLFLTGLEDAGAPAGGKEAEGSKAADAASLDPIKLLEQAKKNLAEKEAEEDRLIERRDALVRDRKPMPPAPETEEDRLIKRRDELLKQREVLPPPETEEERLIARRDALIHARDLSNAIESGDGEAVFDILDNRTQRELRALKASYGDKLEDDLRAHFSGKDLEKALDMLDGVKFTEHPDKSQTKTYPDGSTVRLQADGRVVEATATDGHTRKFHYDGAGALEQIDGRLGHWERSVDREGKSAWANSNTGDVWKGEFRVDDDGNLHLQPRNGQAWIFTRNGQEVPIGKLAAEKGAVTYNADGTSVETGAGNFSITRDEDGRATRIVRPDGKKIEITYGAMGPVEIAGKDSLWTKDADGEGWTHTDTHTGDRYKAKAVEVTAHGDVVIKNSDRSVDTYRPDGTTVEERADNSIVEKAMDGRVTRVTRPDGVSVQMDYDGAGLAAITGQRHQWVQQSDGSWTGNDMKTYEQSRARDVQVRDNGDIVIKDEDGSVETYRPDGTTREQETEFKAVERDINNNVVQVIITFPGYER